MGFGDLLLFQFARYDLFDLVLEAQRDLGDFLRVDRRWWDALAAGWKDCEC
jgi:hypothetical protein